MIGNWDKWKEGGRNGINKRGAGTIRRRLYLLKDGGTNRR